MYEKSRVSVLDKALFANPTSEYRAAPLWAWNCKLEPERLKRQIDVLSQMGFGGFHMHTRAGMATEYLGADFMNAVKACVDKASDTGMLAYLYDEDTYPSGFAGGYVTQNIKYRMRYLLFTENEIENTVSVEDSINSGLPALIACFSIKLDNNGTLVEYNIIDKTVETSDTKRYAYLMVEAPSGWFNGQTYVDTLNKEAIAEFLNVTHEKYKSVVGDKFGTTVPAVFTDEPQYAKKEALPFAKSHDDVRIAWTYDLPETFSEAYGIDLVAHLPEVFWDLPNGKISRIRYLYHNHICERFCEAFVDQYGSWCEKNGIAFSGHVFWEPTLESQTWYLGDVMRTYRRFTIPGVDILQGIPEFTTLKQAQSIKNQYGREAMLSELYGVTGWDFDFRGHKMQGDWQAALGVTLRVPHHSWVSMKGYAKRDFPASIGIQSPWYTKYSYIEDHFARINTVLTRGTPIVNIGVIHPIESYWLHYGPEDCNSDARKKMDANFEQLTKSLITNLTDFDFINEALLPTQNVAISDKLTVGKISYSCVIVPACKTLRATTVNILKRYREGGGKLIFLGECPKLVDAVENDAVRELYDSSTTLPFDEYAIYNELREYAAAEIYDIKGTRATDFISTYRQDGNTRYLFLARSEYSTTPDARGARALKIILNGEFDVTHLDTVNGKIEDVSYTAKNGKTELNIIVFSHDSLLLKLSPAKFGTNTVSVQEKEILKKIDFKKSVRYTRHEDNVLVLDMAKYRLDDGELHDTEEVIKIDTACREPLGYPRANGWDVQAWVLGDDVIEHYVTLYFDVMCECTISGARIAVENPKELYIGGEAIRLEPCGYYVDEDIKTYPLPTLKRGKNEITVKVPLGKSTSVEYAYIIGDFDVEVRGCSAVLKAASNSIFFGNITDQGLPFYSGNLSYITEIDTPDCSLNIRASRYRGALLSVRIDGKDVGNIVFAPYTLLVDKIKAGRHTVEFVHYGNRHNTFGWLHNSSKNPWLGPNMWYAPDYDFSYEYCLKDSGILSSPIIEIIK